VGINRQVLKVLLAENERQQFTGNILLVGRSTVTLSDNCLRKLLPKSSYLKLSKSDSITRHHSNGYSVVDESLFVSISDQIANIDVMDVSSYEGANILHDLNTDIPEHLEARYDLIYDSSVLDNIFSPSTGIKNIHKMLKSDGRYVGLNVASFYPGAMTAMHPEWFYGFFCINRYSRLDVLLTEASIDVFDRFDYLTALYKYSPFYTKRPDYDYFAACDRSKFVYHTITIAKKNVESGFGKLIKFPKNLQYIESGIDDDWTKHAKFLESIPPLIGKDNVKFFEKTEGWSLNGVHSTLPHLSDHYDLLGVGF